MTWKILRMWFDTNPAPSPIRFGTRGLLGVPSLGIFSANAREPKQ